MSLAVSLAVKVAERVERTAGPRAGLVSWRTLAGNASDGEVRGKAILSALGCAFSLRDIEAIDQLAAQWSTVDRGLWDGPIASLCRSMLDAKLVPSAIALSGAEARRHRTARSLYCHARCLEVGRDPGAASAFQEAIVRAEKEGAKEIERWARGRRAAILSSSWGTMGEALEEARRVDLAQVPPALRLIVARVLLRSPSRFTRALALATLDDIIVGQDAKLATSALTLVARWVDEAREALTPLELDRVLAIFGRERVTKMAPRAREVARALGQIAQAKDERALSRALEGAAELAPELRALHTRARDITSGRFEAPNSEVASLPSDPALRRAFRYSEILDAAVALRDHAPARAAHALGLLAEAEAAGEHVPSEVLDVAESALRYDDDELREVASRVIAARLHRAASGAPRRGFLMLADALARAGRVELSLLARRAAVVAKEQGAREKRQF
ncbi:MAG TPA: hypothetical protein VM580_12950, partial [Labilithrix sp.]|nr:hypothetical protein [Labilithrix sp.]